MSEESTLDGNGGPSASGGHTPGETGGLPVDEEMSARWLGGVVVLAFFAALAVSVRSVLSPFVLYVLFLYLVWPRLGRSAYGRLAVAASVLVALWIVHVTGLLLAPFVLAFILAYVVDPLVDHLEHWMPRSAAIGLLSLPLLGILALVVFVLVPALARQLSDLISNVPAYLSVVERWLEGLRAWAIGLDVPGLTEQTVPQLGEIDAESIVQYLEQRRSQLADRGLSAVLGIGRGIGVALTIVGYLVLTPILTFYLLRDWDRIRRALGSLVPESRRESVFGFADRFDDLLSRYLRGQVLLASIVGVLIFLGFWIVGFPYALLLGIVAGVLNVVPYLGLFASLAVAILISLLSGAVLPSLVKVAVVFGVEQLIENILAPVIVGESVGLHPVWVILALALFSFFFGFVGLLLAMPAAVFLKLVVETTVQRYWRSSWFRQGSWSG